jgi:hypothetical protein
VHVLEHEDGRSSCSQLANERRHNLVRHHPARYDLLELAAGALGYRKQRPEGTRSEERIAAAPEDPRRLAAFLAEPPEERSLPHPGLTPDEHHVSPRAAMHCPKGFAERREFAGALEQLTRRGRDVGGRDLLHTPMVNLEDQRASTCGLPPFSHESQWGAFRGSKPRRSRSQNCLQT